METEHVVKYVQGTGSQRPGGGSALERRRKCVARRRQANHEIIVSFPDGLGFAIGRIVEPREPYLLDIHGAESSLAMNKTAEMIVVLMGPDNDVQRLVPERLLDLA